MRIPAPNYTQTPNVFFDEIMKDLNEGELRVILFIMRQTFGWRKEWDWITLSQMSKKTGYDRRSVIRILKSLSEKGLILKRKIGGAGVEKCYYSLVTEEHTKDNRDPLDGVETQEEMELFQKSYTSDTPVTPPVTRQSPPPVTDGSPTKETLTKEKQQQQKGVVVVSSNEEVKKPLIHPCLKGNTKVSLEVQVDLTRRFDENTVKNALEYAETNKKNIRTTYVAYLIMACQKVLKIEKKAITENDEVSYEEQYDNRQIALDFIKKNWQEQNFSSVTDKVDRVNIGNDILMYKDKKFKELFNHYLLKLRH